MPVPDDDVAGLFHGAYTALVEPTPPAPTFDELTSRLQDPTQRLRLIDTQHGAVGPGEAEQPGDVQLNGSSPLDLPAGALEVLELGDTDGAAPAARSKRRLAFAFTVAAAVLLVVGIVVSDRDDGSVRTDVAAEPSVGDRAAPSVTVPPAVSDPGSLWSLVSYEDGAAIAGVVAGGPGFVAVGERDGDAAVWTSLDGLSWSRVPHDQAVFGGTGESFMVDVTIGGPGLVAVGRQEVCSDLPEPDESDSAEGDARGNDPVTVCSDRHAVVWTSVDGLSW